MRKLFTLLTTLIIVVTGGCGDSINVEPLNANAVILAFGDSVTYGTGARANQDYPHLLAQQTGLTVVNAGIPGDTAVQATQRIEETLDRHQPDLVIVELGGNDFLARRSVAEVAQNLKEIIQTIQARNIQVILVAVPEFSLFRASTGTLKDSSIYPQLGEELGVPVIEGLFAEILSDKTLTADPIHPNAEGYRLLAAGMHQFLAKTGFISEQ